MRFRNTLLSAALLAASAVNIPHLVAQNSAPEIVIGQSAIKYKQQLHGVPSTIAKPAQYSVAIMPGETLQTILAISNGYKMSQPTELNTPQAINALADNKITYDEVKQNSGKLSIHNALRNGSSIEDFTVTYQIPDAQAEQPTTAAAKPPAPAKPAPAKQVAQVKPTAPPKAAPTKRVPNAPAGQELTREDRIAANTIDVYTVTHHKADGSNIESRLGVPLNKSVIEMYSVDEKGNMGVFDFCPNEYVTIKGPPGNNVRTFLPTNRNSPQVRAMFNDNIASAYEEIARSLNRPVEEVRTALDASDFVVTYDELASELTRAKTGHVKATLNAALTQNGKQYASSRANIVLTLNPNCAPQTIISDFSSNPADVAKPVAPPERTAAQANDVPSTPAPSVEIAKVEQAKAPKVSKPAPYGSSYNQLTIGVGGGLLNMEGKDNFGNNIPPLSSGIKQFKVQFARYTPKTLSYVSLAHTSGTDAGPSGIYNTFLSNRVKSTSLAAGGDVRLLGVGKVGIGIGGQIQYTGTSTNVGGYNQTSRKSDVYYSGGPELIFNKFNRSFGVIRAEATGQASLGKYDTMFGPYRASSNVDINPAIYTKWRLFLGDRLFTDIEGRYGVSKNVFATSTEDRISGKSINWNGSIGFGYDLHRNDNHAVSLGFKVKHAGSQSTFPIGPTYLNGNSAEIQLNFTSGKK